MVSVIITGRVHWVCEVSPFLVRFQKSGLVGGQTAGFWCSKGLGTFFMDRCFWKDPLDTNYPVLQSYLHV